MFYQINIFLLNDQRKIHKDFVLSLLTFCDWLVAISYLITLGSITNPFFVNTLYARVSNRRAEPPLTIQRTSSRTAGFPTLLISGS